MAAKRITVMQFALQFGAAGDPIPVKVRRGAELIGTAPSVYKLASVGSLGVLESKISFVTLTRDEVLIQVK